MTFLHSFTLSLKSLMCIVYFRIRYLSKKDITLYKSYFPLWKISLTRFYRNVGQNLITLEIFILTIIYSYFNEYLHFQNACLAIILYFKSSCPRFLLSEINLIEIFYVVYYKPNAYYVYLYSGKSLGVMPANINLFFSQWVHMGLSGSRECGSLRLLHTSRGWRGGGWPTLGLGASILVWD